MSEIKLGRLIKRIDLLIKQKLDEVLNVYDLTSTQTEVLLYLKKSKTEISQKDIEQHFNISNPTVTGILNRLEVKGFINRVIDKNDARKRIVVLSDKAHELLNEIKDSLDDYEAVMLSCLSKEETQELKELLMRVSENMKGVKKND